MILKIYGNFCKYSSLSNGELRLYVDIPEQKALELFTHFGIPTKPNPVPVYIASAEHPPATSDTALGIPPQKELTD